jgi:hypothetical protein
MRRRWVSFGLILIVITAGILSTWIIADKGVFQVGSILHGWQLTSEMLYQGMLPEDARSEYKLELVERRFADLLLAAGTNDEAEAFTAFNLALRDGIQGVEPAPDESVTVLRATMAELGEQALSAVRYIRPVVENRAGLEDLVARMRYINAWAVDSKLSFDFIEATVAENWDERALHEGFPLQDRHQEALCEDCHREKDYVALDMECSVCHAGDLPDRHFPGECGLCHRETGWEPANFPHLEPEVMDCAACHARRAPENHFRAQCSACHEFGDWDSAKFNHAAVDTADCQRCHLDDLRETHFPGQCSLCHSYEEWTGAGFDHLAVEVCGSCHEKQRPDDHFPGDCSACHSPGVWANSVFNHQGVDGCVQCHETWRPPGHFEGDCSLCHRPGSFTGATFNHAGVEDCLACHREDRPSGHFERQCSQCHSTDGWSNPVFSHTFPRNHGGANPGSCGTCHAAGLGSYTCFACHDAGKVDSEHREEGVNYHSNCAACHPYGND